MKSLLGTYAGRCACPEVRDGDHLVMATTRIRRQYDHRLRRLVQKTGDVQLAVQNCVPRSTARDWSRLSTFDVVSLDVSSVSQEALQQEVVALRRRHANLLAILRLVVVLLKVSGFTLANRRIADGAKKLRLFRTVERSRTVLSLRKALRILGLSPTRYHSWQREESCQLDDISSCPRTFPHQVTVEELGVIKEMATSEEYRHVPTGTLALLAQRLGKVYASAATWYRLVRRHRWRRPRRRIHPHKPKLGIGASSCNEIWHIDTTVIRLLDGTRAYLHAVIDNFSRKILSWRISERLNPGNTVAVLNEARQAVEVAAAAPTLLADGGVENVNAGVDELIDGGVLRRVLAQTEIAFSNSLIESWWRALKHQWLYLNTLDTVQSVQRLVSFYVEEHNSRLPHSAFRGETPDEIYFGTGGHIRQDLQSRRMEARAARMASNRSATCRSCERSRHAS